MNVWYLQYCSCHVNKHIYLRVLHQSFTPSVSPADIIIATLSRNILMGFLRSEISWVHKQLSNFLEASAGAVIARSLKDSSGPQLAAVTYSNYHLRRVTRARALMITFSQNTSIFINVVIITRDRFFYISAKYDLNKVYIFFSSSLSHPLTKLLI